MGAVLKMKNEEIWNQPLPEHLIICHSTPDKLPKNRKEWAEGIYNWIYAVEESTVIWDKDTAIILDEAIQYFQTYKLEALAWFAKRLKIGILNPETWDSTEDSLSLQCNSLRGIFHDECRNPSECPHTKDTRATIERRYSIEQEV